MKHIRLGGRMQTHTKQSLKELYNNLRYNQVKQQQQKVENIPTKEEISTFSVQTMKSMLRNIGIGIPKKKLEIANLLMKHHCHKSKHLST